MPQTNRLWRRSAAVALSLALLGTACGGAGTETAEPIADPAPAATQAPAAEPATTEPAAAPTTAPPTTAPTESPAASEAAAPETNVAPVKLVTGVDGNEFDLSPAGEETILWFWAPW